MTSKLMLIINEAICDFYLLCDEDNKATCVMRPAVKGPQVCRPIYDIFEKKKTN